MGKCALKHSYLYEILLCSLYTLGNGSGNFASLTQSVTDNAFAVTNYNDPAILAEVSEDLGEAMVGINKDEIEKLENIKMAERGQ